MWMASWGENDKIRSYHYTIIVITGSLVVAAMTTNSLWFSHHIFNDFSSLESTLFYFCFQPSLFLLCFGKHFMLHHMECKGIQVYISSSGFPSQPLRSLPSQPYSKVWGDREKIIELHYFKEEPMRSGCLSKNSNSSPYWASSVKLSFFTCKKGYYLYLCVRNMWRPKAINNKTNKLLIKHIKKKTLFFTKIFWYSPWITEFMVTIVTTF